MTFHIFDKQDLKLYGLDYTSITFGLHDIQEYEEMMSWCKKNFGDPHRVVRKSALDFSSEMMESSTPHRQRWYIKYSNNFWFRDKQDYTWFLLRWT